MNTMYIVKLYLTCRNRTPLVSTMLECENNEKMIEFLKKSISIKYFLVLENTKTKQLSVFRRRKVGLIYQFYNLIPTLDVKQNILLPLLLDGQKPEEESFRELSDTLGLSDRLSHLPSQLSGGQQQRAAIGRALIYRPAVLLADEPTGNLDRKNSEEILALLKLSNKRYHQTIVLITHDERIALEMCIRDRDRYGSVLDFCRLNDITIQTWSPFQYGFFEGVFLGNDKFEELNKLLKELAEKYNTTDTAIAAAWIMRHPAGMQLVAGTMKLSRLQEICRASEIVLTREEWYQIYLAGGHILP